MKIKNYYKLINIFSLINVNKSISKLLFFLFLLLNLFSIAHAELSLDLYSGYQTSPHSKVHGEFLDKDFGTKPFKFTAGWKGKSLSMPPYYGLRLTNWKGNIGWGVDFNHTKAYADKRTLEKSNFKKLEFTDGLNNFTIHRQSRFKDSQKLFTPYFGFGLGITIPHVEIQADESQPITFEYQYGGLTSAFNGGLKYALNNNRAIFLEYKFTASWLDVNITEAGFFKTRIFTNAVNLGYSFGF
jgi:lipid A oxidase